MSGDQQTNGVKVFLGLGGNVGDVIANFKSALQMLDATANQHLVRVSPVYRTPPWGDENQDWFYNACAQLQSQQSPMDLLKQCKMIETDLKRQKTRRWGPRSIDIDILIYGDLEKDLQSLTLPHPRMLERTFVLKPLADIAADTIVSGKSIQHWLDCHGEVELERIDLADDWYQIKEKL